MALTWGLIIALMIINFFWRGIIITLAVCGLLFYVLFNLPAVTSNYDYYFIGVIILLIIGNLSFMMVESKRI